MKFRLTASLSRAFKTQRKINKLIATALKVPHKKTKRSRSLPPPAQFVLEETAAFGSNPGRLVMKSYVPARLQKDPALVVVLHGCRQTPESLDAASGFSKLAKERGFVLLYPQQRKANNAQGCFNWFRPSSVARDRGELLSIKQMVEHARQQHRIDRTRIFIGGLSAGGAMTAALVAVYPELFAGAAIFAGMPFGSARDAMSALRAMKSGTVAPAGGWGRYVTELSSNAKSWPAITIWHGTYDRTVHPINAVASVRQWLEVHGIVEGSGRLQEKPWGRFQYWKVAGAVQVAYYSVNDLDHGVPVKSGAASKLNRAKDPFVRPSGISAPLELMRLWGLKRL
jgi:poly(hydroxyalkanoate) depolymerase family esterase